MRVGVLLSHHVSELDAVGPIAVLNAARAQSETPEALEIATLAKSRNSVQTAAELTLTPTWAFASAPEMDVVIVPGGPGALQAARDRAVRRYLEAARPRLWASIGSGALILGELGLLRDHPVTTHPSLRARIEDYEVLRVTPDPLVQAEGLWTARDGAAGLQLGLALVRAAFSDDLARETARQLGLSHP
jgi:transcriptional regulator GlxA family with amidase domain